MNELLQKLVGIAMKEVGIREEGGNNCGKEVREFQAATWLAPGPWAWCAALQCWIQREWLKDPEVLFALGVPPDDADKWRCQDASAFGWEKWARQKGLKVLPDTATAKAGDIVIFEFSHIGLVKADQYSAMIETIEGNTTGKDTTDRDSTAGDGVWKKTRSPSLVKCYIRLLS
jgi:hypothetical protein